MKWKGKKDRMCSLEPRHAALTWGTGVPPHCKSLGWEDREEVSRGTGGRGGRNEKKRREIVSLAVE